MTIDRNALVKRQIAALEGLALDRLRDKFEELYGFPSRVANADTLRRRIAYRLQELQFGGFPPSVAQFLAELADGARGRWKARGRGNTQHQGHALPSGMARLDRRGHVRARVFRV
jgi:hypothetical protein